jgi:hypothetical protein
MTQQQVFTGTADLGDNQSLTRIKNALLQTNWAGHFNYSNT